LIIATQPFLSVHLPFQSSVSFSLGFVYSRSWSKVTRCCWHKSLTTAGQTERGQLVMGVQLVEGISIQLKTAQENEERGQQLGARTTMIIISLLDSLWKFICVLELNCLASCISIWLNYLFICNWMRKLCGVSLSICTCVCSCVCVCAHVCVCVCCVCVCVVCVCVCTNRRSRCRVRGSGAMYAPYHPHRFPCWMDNMSYEWYGQGPLSSRLCNEFRELKRLFMSEASEIGLSVICLITAARSSPFFFAALSVRTGSWNWYSSEHLKFYTYIHIFRHYMACTYAYVYNVWCDSIAEIPFQTADIYCHG